MDGGLVLLATIATGLRTASAQMASAGDESPLRFTFERSSDRS